MVEERVLSSFQNKHRHDTILVCGCGASLNQLEYPERYITIGVNDVGRKFQPNYLVVVNPRNQFSAERYPFVIQSGARVVFTHLSEREFPHPRAVRFRLGKYGGTDFLHTDVLHYTQNSPYVALCLAAYMGATSIGLIGVDFTDHHFFASTGRHPLARQLRIIDAQYRRLGQALLARGIKVFNLSEKSLLTAFPKKTLSAFAKGDLKEAPDASVSDKQVNIHDTREKFMKISVIGGRQGPVGTLLDALAETASALGHQVIRNSTASRDSAETLSIVWNGRSHVGAGPVLFCEHGWLPRSSYQISAQGINADSHIAPFKWDGKALTAEDSARLKIYLDGLRKQALPTPFALPEKLPDSFILVPLQMEWDTNITRHAPIPFRRMQGLVDALEVADPPLPIVFKQHPADSLRANQHLRLSLRRPQDRILPQTMGDIHLLLSSGRCRGVITINSNVAHDALLWDIPVIALGKNVWPRVGSSPFLNELPTNWGLFFDRLKSNDVRACSEAYAAYLIASQWTTDNARDPQRVAALLQSVSKKNDHARSFSVKNRIGQSIVNVVAANRGWLFEDYKRLFSRVELPGVSVQVSESPLARATGWIFLRAAEVAASPDPSRTVVQIHDTWDDGMYCPGGARKGVAACGGITLTQPMQRELIERAGISFVNKQCLVRPMGALQKYYNPTTLQLNDQFTVIWIGRPVHRTGEDISRLDWLVEGLRLSQTPRVMLLGERLDAVQRRLQKLDIACEYYDRTRFPFEHYPELYARADCLLITTQQDVGSHYLFEAMASGIPVVSTSMGWSPHFIRVGENGFLVENIDALSNALLQIKSMLPHWRLRRSELRRMAPQYSLESWIEDNVHLSLSLSADVRQSVRTG